MKILLLSCSITILFLLIGCRETGTSSEFQPAVVISEPDTTIIDNDSSKNDRIFIVDRTGKKWDVTHAVKKYNFTPENFQYGLGPNAIKPILDPQMISPGDRGYPGSGDNLIVIGVILNGESRAYPLEVLYSHEIVDEKFGDMHVAVAF